MKLLTQDKDWLIVGVSLDELVLMAHWTSEALGTLEDDEFRSRTGLTKDEGRQAVERMYQAVEAGRAKI